MINNNNLIGNSKSMTDFLGNQYKYECLGCAMSSKQIPPPGGIIYENDCFILACDPEVPILGFLVLNTKKHINSLIELSQDEQHLMTDILNKAISILKKLEITNEITLVQEERSKHFHIWIFPNHDWMNKKFGKGVSYVRDICSFAQENATSIDKENILKVIENIRKEFKEF